MTLDKKLSSDRIYLKKLSKTLEQSTELCNLVKKNKNHLIPYADWEMFSTSPGEFYEKIIAIDNDWKNGKSFNYGIFDATTNKLIGSIFATHFSLENKNTELGYWLDVDYLGRGIMKEAVTILENELFKKGIIKVIIKTDTENTHSANLAKSLGYELEGTLKKDQFNHILNEIRDFNIFAKIKP